MSDRARLVLLSPIARDDATIGDRLAEALAGAPAAAVILRLPADDERLAISSVKRVRPIVQDRDAALLLADRPEIVARSGADGVHVGDPVQLAEALRQLRPHQRLVGAGGLRTRHDAMEAAEAGCDYVMIGEPDASGAVPPFAAVLERAQWWAELFETPCIAYCPDLSLVAALAATGCEFIALGEAVFRHAQGPRAAMAEALAAISSAAR